MIKRIFLTIICLLMIAIPCTVSAVVPAFRRVIDFDGLLTNEQVSEIEAKLDDMSEAHNCDVIVATVSSLDGENVEDYSDSLYDYAEYGLGKTRDGIMLLICLESRDWAITSYGNAGRKFTESKISDIADNIKPYLSDDEFYVAFDTFADNCKDILEGKRPAISFSPVWILIAVAIGVSIAFIVVFIMKSQLKSVRSQPAANNYLKSDSLNITHSRDIFLYSTISRRAKPQQTSAGKIGAPGPRQSGKF